MEITFETIDKFGRNIHLTKKQWNHIIRRHPQISSEKEKIIRTIKNPDKIVNPGQFDPDKRFYYKFYKNISSQNKFIRVIVKYLNGNGFIITAQFVNKIK